MRRFFLAWLLLLAGALQASDLADFQFTDPAQERAFRELTEELRCLVCQNESLAGSQAELAQDLRRSVYEMLIQGQSKEQIIRFLVDRYGDFVLYDPPLKPATYPIWFGPFLLAGLGGFLLFRTLARRNRARETELSAQEQARLKALLDASSTSGEPKP